MRSIFLSSLVVPALIIAGCSRNDQEIRVSSVPKQPEPVVQAQMPMGSGPSLMAAAAAAPGEKEVQWIVPTGWKEMPGDGGMRYATLQVSASSPEVVLTVIPLNVSPLLANVNRWREQLGLPAVAEQDLPKVVTRVDANGMPADTVDMLGPDTAKPRLAMLAAIIQRGEQSWFFKLAGPADVVSPQKANFDAYIKSVRFSAGAAAPAGEQMPAAGGAALPAGHPAIPGAAPTSQPQMPPGHPAIPGAGAAAMPAVEAAPTEITYQIPAGWVKDDPMPMRAVSFHVGQAEKQVDVIVSKLPAIGTGGYLDNINRWRGQVGLAPIKQGDPQPSTPLKVGGADANVFDFVGTGDQKNAKHMVVAWVTRGDEWWFFKLAGTDDVVTQQQAAFNTFLGSVQFVGAKP